MKDVKNRKSKLTPGIFLELYTLGYIIGKDTEVYGKEILDTIKMYNTVWQPSHGTFYPVINNMLKEGLIEYAYEYDSKKYWDYKLNSDDDGVEKVQDIFARCNDFLNYLYERHPNQSILIVSHGSPIRALHHILSNSDLYGDLLDVEINNCYCEEFEIEEK